MSGGDPPERCASESPETDGRSAGKKAFRPGRSSPPERQNPSPYRDQTSCCIASSYKAKAFGVKTGTGTGTREARILCPGMNVTVHHNDFLDRPLRRVAPILRTYSVRRSGRNQP